MFLGIYSILIACVKIKLSKCITALKIYLIYCTYIKDNRCVFCDSDERS